MCRFLYLILSFFRRKSPQVILSLLWIAGLISGSVVCLLGEQVIVPDSFPALFGDLNFGGLFSVRMLPFLLTALSILLSRVWLLIPVIFSKAFLFSFVAISFMKSFGVSGGIITAFCLFSDFLTLPFLLFFWQRSICCENFSFFRTGCLLASVVFVVCFFDFHYLVPYVVQLF